MSKLAEGGFNHVFTLTLEDGFEMIAKIPYHIAKLDQFATASEVATLEFLRLQEIPVPEVYAYSMTAENDVGTEYVLMEKAPGVCLSSRWLDLKEKEMRNIAHSFMQIETKLFELPFSATGSIYFKKYLDVLAPHLQAPLYKEGNSSETSQFCIGPIADYMFWYGRKKGLELNRGPWTSPVEYLHSIAQKEITWTQKFGKPKEPDFPHNLVDDMRVQQPEDYLKLLHDYQALTPHLLPKDPAHPFNQPVLRHPDITPGNIFMSTETGRITSLIDWQHAIVQPRLLAAGYPRAFENPDNELTPKLIKPKLPDNLSDLDVQEQAVARELFHQRMLFFGYRVLNGHFNQTHIACLRDPLLLGRQMLVDSASGQWTGNLVTLKGAVIRSTQFWEHLPDVENVKCPIEFSPAELDQFAEIEDGWLKMSVLVEQWRDRACGMTEEGWVRTQDYEEAKMWIHIYKLSGV
ncbi:hypothetical protein J1614_000103 [Plenodomus biglobosus]|nr:hypothetical protein J1614_000103 [Plenodomus biglobosus]